MNWINVKTQIFALLSMFMVSAPNQCSAQTSLDDIYKVGFQQAPLTYGYDAIQQSIDAQTMEIHYTKHAAAYAKNTNDELGGKTDVGITDLLSNISKRSTKLRNNAGGHFNHELFWQLLSPTMQKIPTPLEQAITKDFGSIEAFKKEFEDAAKGRFGSGWAWLVLKDGKLVISSTPNQDNPLMDLAEVKGYPILGIDVWEHAYYLRYQQKRADYVSNFWNVINWNRVNELHQQLIKFKKK